MIYSLLVGLGGMGKVHYKNALKLDNVKFVASLGATDSDRETAKEFGIDYYTNIDDAISSHPEIQVIDITVPTFLHKEYVKEALERGFDVIVEKPMALSSKDAVELFELAERVNKHIYAAHVLRYTKEYKFIIDAIKTEKYGRLLDAKFSRLSATPAWDSGSWLSDKKKSGLVPFDLHIHDLDIIVASCGFPLSNSVKVERSYGLFYSIDYSYGDYKVTAEAAWIDAPMPFSATYRAIFENAVVIYDGTSLKVYTREAVEDIDISYSVTISTGINVPATGWYYEELKEIFNLIEKNEQSNVKKEEVIEELKIVEDF